MSPVPGIRFKVANDSCDHLGGGAVAEWEGPGTGEHVPHKGAATTQHR